jgi:hemerythrin-like domain-containing protein
MKAIDILNTEHRMIERLLSALEIGAWMISVDEPLQSEFFTESTDFIIGFADCCHHKKEEGVLFTAMRESGDEQGNSMVAAMIHEHELARSYTHALCQAVNRMKDGDESAVADVVYHSRHYAALLRNHIAMEDKFVFPLSSQIIPPEQLDEINQMIEKFSQEESANGTKERFLALIEKLEGQTFITPSG